jgi:hypothetical protein
MNWTKEKPTAEGWYWYLAAYPLIYYVGINKEYNRAEVFTGGLLHGTTHAESLSGEWYGPIEVPKHD